MGDRETAADFIRVPARTLDATVEFVLDDPANPKFLADVNSIVAAFLRFGLWDNAFRAQGNFKRSDNERDDFVGADSRRFYIRVRHPSRAGEQTVQADWFTMDGFPGQR